MQSLLFFIIALAILITVHEFGHFWVARRCGVKVLKFSIGFGRPLWQTTAKDGTQYILAALPLGGYVKMLDEREGEVPIEQLNQAFNRQSLGKRTAIIAAGPMANLLFAVVAYWLVFIMGIPGIKPIIAQVEIDSPAALAHLLPGDHIKAINGQDAPTWSSVNQALMAIAQEGGVAELLVVAQDSDTIKSVTVAKQTLITDNPKSIIKQLGLTPTLYDLKPIVGKVIPKQAAGLAGFLSGDIILSANGLEIETWQSWVEVIKISPDKALTVIVSRNNQLITLKLTPKRSEQGIGYIGAGVDASATPMPESLKAQLHYTPLLALPKAIQMTWRMSSLTVQSLLGILKGELSAKNIGGPIRIAQFAGESAEQGIVNFISFLAIISISLGILNLLPIPILDGGHLMLNFIEWVRGKPVSESLELQGQKIGIIMLVTLMIFAFFNDLSRLFGI